VAVIYVLNQYLNSGPSSKPIVLIIKRGSSVSQVAKQLRKSGVIENKLVFILGARLESFGKNFKAGEYFFPAGISYKKAAEILASGKTVNRRITITEGTLSHQIFARVATTPGLFGNLNLYKISEGIFLPETYFYSYGDKRSALLNRMQKKLKKTLLNLWQKRGPKLAIETSQEALILASILEKETSRATERYKISGIFHNRLRLGMRLQSDPTVSYALTKGKAKLDRPINYSDLKFDSPYNTYLYKGLPPGPIANPGRAAIEAALHPVKTNFLFFVADGKGGHRFASTLFKHNQNVLKWRRLKQKHKN